MHAIVRPAYALLARTASLAAALAPAGEGKLARAVHARRGVRARFAAWAAAHREAARPLLWVHAPSVGEGLQARPVLEWARRARPDVQCVYTFYSPSAERFARGLVERGLADHADYLPFDTPGDAHALLDGLRPSALVFAKLDVWPVLVDAARARGVRLGMVSATLAAGSSRTGGLAALLLRDAYAALDAVGAIAEDDAARLRALGVRPERIRVTGDTRYDQVWARARAAERDAARAAPPLAPLLAPPGAHRFTLVAGSTWPADDAVLLPAWTTLAADRGAPPARLVVAPHEPTSAHLAPVAAWAERAGLTLARLSAVERGEATGDVDVLLVDRVGVLGDLYAVGQAAFVGGGFHAAGLHSVLEPAAFGLPVAFGPRHANSRDAGLLLARGGGTAPDDTGALAATLRRWRDDEPTRVREGAAARALVESGLGADARTWTLVEALLPRVED
ncbi:MAG TPA: glycosyltransferase N-terminal domain-containing protein [Gemmatirosa sp.]|nr:glycosyltransferase N-terminal domain-containing protein [Gemmatirosa sp.]